MTVIAVAVVRHKTPIVNGVSDVSTWVVMSPPMRAPKPIRMALVSAEAVPAISGRGKQGSGIQIWHQEHEGCEHDGQNRNERPEMRNPVGSHRDDKKRR